MYWKNFISIYLIILFNFKFFNNFLKSEKAREKEVKALKRRFTSQKLFGTSRNKYLIQLSFTIQKPPGYSRFAGSKVHFYSGIERGV